MLPLPLSLLTLETTGRNERFWNANRSDLSLRVIREGRCGCIQKFGLRAALWTRFEAIRGRGYRLVRGGYRIR